MQADTESLLDELYESLRRVESENHVLYLRLKQYDEDLAHCREGYIGLLRERAER